MIVDFTTGAKADLRAIGSYIAQDSTGDAARFVGELIDACHDLATFPRRFPAEPRYGPAAHRRVYGNYLIIYEIVEDTIDILTIVHAARDIDALLD